MKDFVSISTKLLRKFYIEAKQAETIPRNMSFHAYLIYRLRDVLGTKWWGQQQALPSNEQHFIYLCYEGLEAWIDSNNMIASHVSGRDLWYADPDGFSKTLLLLAFDVLTLDVLNNLPSALFHRLQSKDQYQGVRYEIAVAAILTRLDCDIEFTDKQGKGKRCEFVATHRETGFKLAVEVKSRARYGVIHRPGLFNPRKLSGRVSRLLHKALGQNPKNIPFAVFIDVNVPLTPDVPIEDKDWVKEVHALVFRKLKALSPRTDPPPTFVCFTNFSYHYQHAKQGAFPSESYLSLVAHSKFPTPSEYFVDCLRGAMNDYGSVPYFDD